MHALSTVAINFANSTGQAHRSLPPLKVKQKLLTAAIFFALGQGLIQLKHYRQACDIYPRKCATLCGQQRHVLMMPFTFHLHNSVHQTLSQLSRRRGWPARLGWKINESGVSKVSPLFIIYFFAFRMHALAVAIVSAVRCFHLMVYFAGFNLLSNQ